MIGFFQNSPSKTMEDERVASLGQGQFAVWPGRPMGFETRLEQHGPCELCGHHYAHRHRLVPGCWGGEYKPGNCIWLCPNHHEGIHFLMASYYCSTNGPTLLNDVELQERRWSAYHTDRPLKLLFLTHVKSIVRDRLRIEGRWHPYVRTVPAEPKFVIPK